MALNMFICEGRLTSAPSEGQTQKGNSLARFRVAVTRNFRNQMGDYDADFFNFTAYGQQANYILKYGATGSLVSVVSELHDDEYDRRNGDHVEDKQGTVRAVHVLARSSKRSGYQTSANQVGNRQATNQQQPTQPEAQSYDAQRPEPPLPDDKDAPADNGKPVDVSEDDLPF